MAITVIRRTGWVGSASAITLKVNNEKVEKVRTRQQVEVDLPSNEANLTVTQAGAKSNEIVVKDGEIVEITSNKWYQLLFVLPFIIIFLPNLVSNVTLMLIGLVLLVGLAISAAFLFEAFHLKVVDETTNRTQ
ncbi:hypothetical protein [Pisciglobus halotolerans]|uniref:Uncharacterized protein n=1 Tax=Pisciglobus halotolerans TaxID=745365 RepID=A0A1I3AQV1_9LACT|nr:hypothetical protein [Pisciglobus halotolerans]SFH52435.1 hypothetical protein SAMN04489868_101145 [Pisciglobus halotolerans]